jgi:hypothetical protein
VTVAQGWRHLDLDLRPTADEHDERRLVVDERLLHGADATLLRLLDAENLLSGRVANLARRNGPPSTQGTA